MGFFNRTPEEKAAAKEKSAMFIGTAMQPIGKITQGDLVTLSLDPDRKVLKIFSKPNEITLPYDRISGFTVESETELAKSGGTIGRALAGGLLFGGAGAVVGGMSGKGNTEKHWIGVLRYIDKEGNSQELAFLQWNLVGHYDGNLKNNVALNFENTIKTIAVQNAEEITEL